MSLSSIEEVIKDASKGKIFILVDDEDRENEGDLCVLGKFASPEAINLSVIDGTNGIRDNRSSPGFNGVGMVPESSN